MSNIIKYITPEFLNNPYLVQLLRELKKEEIDSDQLVKEDIYCPECTPIRISTMTITSNMNTELNLLEIFNMVEISDTYPIIEGIKLGSELIKGKFKEKKKKPGKKNYFQNQITMIIKLENTLKIPNLDELKANIKIFKNGKIQMTGIKSNDHYKMVIDYLYLMFTEFHKRNNNILDINEFKISNYNVVLINSDFRTNFEINRENIYKYLYKTGYFVIYEPDIYPGVNLKYFWNSDNKTGICNCTEKCIGKGTGCGNGQCKRITIAIFQSGSVIITGSNTLDRMHTCYKFINTIFKENYKSIKI